jgi:hypothetical protein
LVDPQSPFALKSTGFVTPNRTVVSLSRSMVLTSVLFAQRGATGMPTATFSK